MVQYRILTGALLLMLAITAPALAQESITRTYDSMLTQKFTSDFGYSFMLPGRAKLNPIGSEINRAGATQLANYILPGGAGALKIRNFKEQQVVPPGYKLMDSIVVFDRDSVGTNGHMYFRNYILRDMAVQIEVLLTAKGEKEYAAILRPMFDSFMPPEGADKALQEWRYERGRDRFQNQKQKR